MGTGGALFFRRMCLRIFLPAKFPIIFKSCSCFLFFFGMSIIFIKQVICADYGKIWEQISKSFGCNENYLQLLLKSLPPSLSIAFCWEHSLWFIDIIPYCWAFMSVFPDFQHLQKSLWNEASVAYSGRPLITVCPPLSHFSTSLAISLSPPK